MLYVTCCRAETDGGESQGEGEEVAGEDRQEDAARDRECLHQ